MDARTLTRTIIIAVVALGVLTVAIFGFNSWTTTRHVDPGTYGIVIYFHNDGSKEVDVYPGGYQYSVGWLSNTKEWSYSASVQTIKIYRSTQEGIAPYADDTYCHDVNGVQFSGDVEATFVIERQDVYTVYSQHPDLDLNGAGAGAVDGTIAGVVVRPVLQAAWQNACASRTYTQFQQQEYTSVESDMIAYATPRLKAAGVTLLTLQPQTVYLPAALQDSINAIATANAQLQASQVAVQTAKNEADALALYQQEIAKDPALLKLLIIEKVLEKWDGHGQIPSYVVNAGN